MIQITVNGTSQQIDAPGDMPLLWVLRDVLGLTGTKFGCGIAECGACMVLAGGDPVYSCTTTLADVAGQEITTIEGLSEPAPHPVQVAWLEENVSQCGYCQPGQIISAVALLANIPQPSDQDIDRAMSGNLCRCGTYPRIRKAIHRATRSNEEADNGAK